MKAQFTTAYSPQHNGITEKKNKHLGDGSLFDYLLPIFA